MNRSISYSVFSDSGDREVNEDSAGVFNRGDSFCFVVCDGLGGHGLGEVASKLAIDVFENQFLKFSDAKQFMKNSFYAAQDIILAEQNRYY